MDCASAFLQKPARAIRSPRRHERRDGDQLALRANNRARTGEKIVERELHQVGLIQVLRYLCSDNKVSN